jgi:malto-oligosyltrehalose trehalohydrolase
LYDAQWNDDIHHTLHVLLTGESDGYYADYSPDPMRHLCRCLTEGFAYQGEHSEYHGETRGEPSDDLPPTAFVSFLQNHDQVGNRALGERITQLSAPHKVRAAMEILLLSPQPPMLFMGEEFAASSPFLYFCDFHGDLATAVREGRRNEFARFARFGSSQVRESIPDPNAENTYFKSRLNWQELQGEVHADWLDFYRELLALRHSRVVPHLEATSTTRCETSRFGPSTVSVDWTFEDGARLGLHSNLGDEPVSFAAGHSGTPFYASSREAAAAYNQGSLLPWSVIWCLQD